MILRFTHPPRLWHYGILCSSAWILRALFFTLYMQHDMHYQQPDTLDYHVGAWLISHNYGMTYPNGKPIFWRTPGYSYFLSRFYNPTLPTLGMTEHKAMHHKILWTQLTICSLMPLATGILAQIITQNSTIIWLSAISGVVHPGYILAATYLLTDGIAALLFTLFLILIFSVLRFPHQTKLSIANTPSILLLQSPQWNILAAACILACYTWIRPMGQCIGLITGLLLFLSTQSTLYKKIASSLSFITLFMLLLAPWFVRNYQLTKSLFFCPLFGLYFNAFPAPKILARIKHIPLEQAHKELSQAAGRITYQELLIAQKEGNGRIVCGENVCMRTAWPLIAQHPILFAYDWITEVIKTTYDLYASQLVALANNCFMWDPLIEFLPEKIAACLYAKPMPLLFRAIAWIEAIILILLWIGIYAGIYTYIITPAWNTPYRSVWYSYGYRLLQCGIFILTVVAQTGGFGYARLRLPVEPLIIICGLIFFVWHREKDASV